MELVDLCFLEGEGSYWHPYADIDECITGLDNCDINADCANTPGSFDCSCIAGYDGDGVTCHGKSGNYLIFVESEALPLESFDTKLLVK